jgi:type I restriction enzyme, S subunit
MKFADDEQFAELGSPSNDSLPQGWAWAPMGTIAHINPAKPHQAALPPDAPVTFVPMPAVDADSGRIIKPKDRPFQTVRSGYTSFKENDVLFAKITPCMENGKVAIARKLTNGLGFGSTEFHVLRPTGAVIPEYLFYFLRQEWFRRAAEAKMTGSVGQRRVPVEFIENALLPLPPLGDQKRIVTRVEELLALVNGAREHLVRVAAILKRFRQAVLSAACSGRLTADWRENQKGLEDHCSHFQNVLAEEQSSGKSNQFARRGLTRVVFKGNKRRSRYEELILSGTGELPELPDGWFWATVAQLASAEPGSIQSGPFGSNLHHSEFQRTGILAIGIDNVLDGKFTPGREHRISPRKYQELVKYAARPLDVLLTVMATVGRCCVLPEDIETAIITKHVYRITVDRTFIRPHYLMFALRGDITVQEHIQNQIRGQTRPGINGQVLKGIPIPTPPILEQREIVRRVEVLFKLADSIEKRVASATARAEKLTQAMLAKAFRGELVPTEAELARREGRSYERASALLARIKTERETKAVSKPARRNGGHRNIRGKRVQTA